MYSNLHLVFLVHLTFATEFGKTCIVQTSDFEHLEDYRKPERMVYRVESFSDDTGIMLLQSLKVSHLYVIPSRFKESPKLKNCMHELCMFSHNYLVTCNYIV